MPARLVAHSGESGLGARGELVAIKASAKVGCAGGVRILVIRTSALVDAAWVAEAGAVIHIFPPAAGVANPI